MGCRASSAISTCAVGFLAAHLLLPCLLPACTDAFPPVLPVPPGWTSSSCAPGESCCRDTATTADVQNWSRSTKERNKTFKNEKQRRLCRLFPRWSCQSQLDPSMLVGCSVFHVETSSFQDNANIALPYTEFSSVLGSYNARKTGCWKITPA